MLTLPARRARRQTRIKLGGGGAGANLGSHSSVEQMTTLNKMNDLFYFLFFYHLVK